MLPAPTRIIERRRRLVGEWIRPLARLFFQQQIGFFVDVAAGSVGLPGVEQLPVAESVPSGGFGLYRRAVEQVRAEFETRTWDAFWQVVVDDRAPAVVAAALGLSVNAVYLARSRVLRRLREALGEANFE